jgi:DNA-binding NarL/FixJ family response regulator
MTIRVLIVDDHAVVAEGLRALIGAQPCMEVVGLASNGRDAIAQTIASQPDVVVMDYAMNELNGIEATAIIKKKFAQIRIVMLSMHSTGVHVHRALQAGVDGYVMKQSVGRELMDAIHAVNAGRRFLSKPLTDEMLNRLISDAPEDPLSRLSARERQVLQMTAEGSSVAHIAVKLSLSPKTVETYRERMRAKLQISDFANLIKFAIQHGVISLD